MGTKTPAGDLTTEVRPHRDRSSAGIGDVPAPRVLVVSGSVGAGHDGAAAELAARLGESGVHVQRRDFLDALPAGSRTVLQRGYTASIAYAPPVFDWLFRSTESVPWVRTTVRRFCELAATRLAEWADGYDTIVSTYPLASHAIGELKAAGCLPKTGTATYLTDPAAHRFWVHPAVNEHLTVTTATAELGRDSYGVPMRVAGPLVSRRFTQQMPTGTRARIRAELGVPADSCVALIMTGSLGLGKVAETVRALRSASIAPIVLCGRNRRLRARLARLGAIALGWRSDVPELMAAADALLHNAGGLSCTEALVAGLPTITYAPIPGHGHANATVLERAGLAPWPRTPEALATTVTAVCRTTVRSELPERTRRMRRNDPATIVAAMATRYRDSARRSPYRAI